MNPENNFELPPIEIVSNDHMNEIIESFHILKSTIINYPQGIVGIEMRSIPKSSNIFVTWTVSSISGKEHIRQTLCQTYKSGNEFYTDLASRAESEYLDEYPDTCTVSRFAEKRPFLVVITR